MVLAFVVLCLCQVRFLNDFSNSDYLVLAVILGSVLAFLLYNIPAFIVRYKGFKWGYDGTEDNFFGLIQINWNKLITVLKTIGQILTSIVFVYGVYYYFEGAVLDAYLVTKITLLSAFIILSIFIKKWNIPNIYLYLGSVLVFTIVSLLS